MPHDWGDVAPWLTPTVTNLLPAESYDRLAQLPQSSGPPVVTQLAAFPPTFHTCWAPGPVSAQLRHAQRAVPVDETTR